MRKIVSIVLSFGLLFQQGGLVYAAGELNLANYLSSMHSVITQPDRFQPARLRYISYDSQNNDFKLLLDKGDIVGNGLKPFPTLGEETKELFNYFLIGLALPNDTFWVNLRPDAADNIIDPILEKTDIGKIFLEADLQLKKDTASLTSPQNPEGKTYWDKLYKKAGELFGTENITIPTITRPWIVPNEVIVRETEDSAYIYKATLKVLLEQDYLKDSVVYNFSDPRLKELNEYSSQIIRETIIPRLTKEVNSSKRYAKLRQVYYSLVLSRWFKQKYSSFGSTRAQEYPSTTLGASQSRSPSANSYLSLIDSGNLDNLASQEPYDKQTYFQAYQKSFKDGEYNLKETVASPFGQSIRSYISGGITTKMNISIVGSPIRGPVTKELKTGLVDSSAVSSASLLICLRDFLGALESHSKSNSAEANGAISNLINTIKQQIKLIKKNRYSPITIKIGKSIIKYEWDYLYVQMPGIENTLSPKYNNVMKLLTSHSEGAGSPVIWEKLLEDGPDSLRYVELNSLSGSGRENLLIKIRESFPVFFNDGVTADYTKCGFAVEVNERGGIVKVVGAWRYYIAPATYLLLPYLSLSYEGSVIDKIRPVLLLKMNRKLEAIREAMAVGSPVVGKKLMVYDGNTAKNVELRYVTDKELSEIFKKMIKERLQAEVFVSKINIDGKEYNNKKEPAAYSFPVVNDAMLEGMYFAVKTEVEKIRSIEGIVYNDGKEIIVYGKTPYIAKAILDVWKKESGVSSAVVSKDGVSKTKWGGIDLTDRALQIKLERGGSFASTPLLLPQVKNTQNLDLDKEFAQVEALASSGIVPNSHRLLELFTVCHYRGEFGQRLSQIISCLKSSSAIQEAEAIDSDEDFRLALMMPEVLS